MKKKRCLSLHRSMALSSGTNPKYTLFLNWLKFILAYAADRTYPIFGKILKCCSRCDAIIRISYLRVILIAAWSTYILFHFSHHILSKLLFISFDEAIIAQKDYYFNNNYYYYILNFHELPCVSISCFFLFIPAGNRPSGHSLLSVWALA